MSAPTPPGALATEPGASLVDGEWHRLHPLTPLMRTGVFVIAIAAFLINQSWQTISSFFIPQLDEYANPYDPTRMVFQNQTWLLWAAIGTLVVVLLLGLFSYLSWRFQMFRVSENTIELKSGVLFRKSRQARLDRVQDINIQRPIMARILGASKLEIGVAGENANVQLSYVRSRDADGLRAAILQRASGAKRQERQAQQVGQPQVGQQAGMHGAPGHAPAGTHQGHQVHRLDQANPGVPTPQQPAVPQTAEQLRTRAADFFADRVAELTGPELAPGTAAPQSVVRLPAWRLVVANLVNPWLVVILVALVAGIIVTVTNGVWWLLVTLLPLGAIFVAVTFGNILPSLNYSIAATPDGVRVGRGLLTTSNDTVPPGRIHAVQVSQPLFWRPFDWWMVRITRAGTETTADAEGNQAQAALTRNLLLPVGTRAETERVLALLLPMLVDNEVRNLIELGMYGKGRDDYFVTAPRRAAWMRPFSWRRHGFRLDDRALYLRFGAWSRKLTIVPAERMQSIGITRGPVGVLANVVNLEAHTVLGIGVTTKIGMIDGDIAIRLFDDVSTVAIRAAQLDTSHRWREAATLSAIATARMRVADAQARGIAVDPQTVAVLQAEREYQDVLARNQVQATATPPVAEPARAAALEPLLEPRGTRVAMHDAPAASPRAPEVRERPGLRGVQEPTVEVVDHISPATDPVNTLPPGSVTAPPAAPPAAPTPPAASTPPAMIEVPASVTHPSFTQPASAPEPEHAPELPAAADAPTTLTRRQLRELRQREGKSGPDA